jgi:hypothetical protein
MRTALRGLCFGLVLLVGACASAGTGSSGGVRREVLASDELSDGAPASLYDAIRTLRSEWLNRHGGGSLLQHGDVMVYVDDARLGTSEVLRNIRTDQVVMARYVNPTEAQARFGSDHLFGAILVTMRR